MKDNQQRKLQQEHGPRTRRDVGVVVPSTGGMVAGGGQPEATVGDWVKRAAKLLESMFVEPIDVRFNSNGKSGGAFVSLDDNPNVFARRTLQLGANQFSRSSLGDRQRVIERGGDPDGPDLFVSAVAMVSASFLQRPDLADKGVEGKELHAYLYFKSLDDGAQWIRNNIRPELLSVSGVNLQQEQEIWHRGTRAPGADGVYRLKDGRFSRFWLGQWRRPHMEVELAAKEELLDAFPSPQFRIKPQQAWTDVSPMKLQQDHAANVARREFRFRVVRSKEANGGEYDKGRFFTLVLSQEEFEDYQGLKARVHEALAAMGIRRDERPAWNEAPVVAEGFEESLREAIGAHADAQFIAYYPHSWHHQSYKEVEVNGVPCVYQSFSSDQIINWAPSMASLKVELRAVAARPGNDSEDHAPRMGT